MKKREKYIDILKIIAAFAVIIIHVSAENWYGEINMNWYWNNIMNALVSSWPVPLFVAISGALLLSNDNFTFKTMITKYIPRILFCLIAWHFIYYFYTVRIFNVEQILICTKKLLIGQTYSHLWYLYLLLGLYLLTPILKKLVTNLTKREFQYLLFFGFFITSLIPFINNFTSYNLNLLIEPYKVFNFSIFIFYYLLGYYLYVYPIKRDKLIFVISIIVLIITSFLWPIYQNKRE